MPLRMIVIAGPPGGGKSSIFPLAKLGTKHFNADDHAAELNGGSYLRIPTHIRETVNREFEASYPIAFRSVKALRSKQPFAVRSRLIRRSMRELRHS